MPCTYTGSFEGDLALAWEEHARKLKREVNKTTRLLCSTMRLLHNMPADRSAHDIFADVLSIPGMAEWWRDHQKRDARHRTQKHKKR